VLLTFPFPHRSRPCHLHPLRWAFSDSHPLVLPSVSSISLLFPYTLLPWLGSSPSIWRSSPLSIRVSYGAQCGFVVALTFQSEHEELHCDLSVRDIDIVHLRCPTCLIVHLVCLLIFASGVLLDGFLDRVNGTAKKVRVAHPVVRPQLLPEIS